jgi:hypothetical protein
MRFVTRMVSWLIIWTSAIGCSTDHTADKIAFDLEILNNDGLIGPESGLRALHYEFCIPVGTDKNYEVASIDPSVYCTRVTGRIGCQTEQLLCQGNTHQNDHRRILEELAELEYVDRIEQSFFE